MSADAGALGCVFELIKIQSVRAGNVLKRLKATLERLHEDLSLLEGQVDDKLVYVGSCNSLQASADFLCSSIIASGHYHAILDSNEEELDDPSDPDTNPNADPSLHPQHPPDQTTSLFQLPAELLMNIIMEAMSDDQHLPMTLSHINRELRAFVTTTSTFWTAIDIKYGPTRVQHYLERSGSAAIDVTASLPPNLTPTQGVQKIDHFVAKILPHSGRIRDLRMVFVRNEWLKAALPFLEVIPKQPRTLEVGLRNTISEDEVYPREVHCEPRHLCLHGAPAWPVRPSLFSRVTTFEFRETPLHHGVTFRDVVGDWLSQMPAVTSITLADVTILMGSPHPVTLTLADLREVQLQRMAVGFVVGLWERIETPQLASLTIDLRVLNWPEQTSLVSVAAANPQLQHLDLANIYTTSQEWSNLFHSLPNLTHLRLAWCSLDDRCLSALSGTGFDASLAAASYGPNGPKSYACPELAHLIFDNELSLTSGQVREIVAARRLSPNSPIRTVVMRGVDGDLMEQADVEEILGSVDHFFLEVVDVEGVEKDVEERNEYTYDSDDHSDDDGSVGSWTSGDRFVAQLMPSQIA